MDKIEINIAAGLENGSCIAAEDGEKVYLQILSSIEQGKSVQLSFEGVNDLTTAFLNTAVGQLYGTIDNKTLEQRMLPPVNASREDLTRLKIVVDRAVDFFKDKDRFKKAADDVLGEDDG